MIASGPLEDLEELAALVAEKLEELVLDEPGQPLFDSAHPLFDSANALEITIVATLR